MVDGCLDVEEYFCLDGAGFASCRYLVSWPIYPGAGIASNKCGCFKKFVIVLLVEISINLDVQS